MLAAGRGVTIFTVAKISRYWRPLSLDEALALLGRPGTVVLAGGTKLNAVPTSEPVEVVDLQALGLDGVEPLGRDTVRIGATTTLQQLADADLPPTVREAARRELPSTLRAQATLGGTIAAADPDSELLAVLLVHGASVTLVERDVELVDLLGELPIAQVILSVTIDTTGRCAVARAARTRADRPIVAAAVRIAPDGARRVAVAGVASTPVLVEEPDELEPPADFRGSREYRRALAEILVSRASEALS